VSNQRCEAAFAACPDGMLKLKTPITAACKDALDTINDNLGGYYSYNLYDDCPYWSNPLLLSAEAPSFASSPQSSSSSSFASSSDAHPFVASSKQRSKRTWFSAAPRMQTTPPSPSSASSRVPLSTVDGGAANGFTCPGGAMKAWLTRKDVRAALQVDPNAFFFSGDNGAGFNYTSSEKNVLPIYRDALLNTNLKVLVYNGDSDPAVNSFGKCTLMLTCALILIALSCDVILIAVLLHTRIS
jgi:hypothetical protein